MRLLRDARSRDVEVSASSRPEPPESDWLDIRRLKEVSYKTPRALRFGDCVVEVSSWRELYLAFLASLYQKNPTRFKELTQLHGRIWKYLSKNKEEIKKTPKKIEGTPFYAEVHLHANRIVQLMVKMMDHLGEKMPVLVKLEE